MLTVMRSIHGARRAFPLFVGAISALVAACGSDQGTTAQHIACKGDSDCPNGQICGGTTCQPSTISDTGGSGNNNAGGGQSTGRCGNGVAEGSEACDGSDLNNKSCESLTSGASTGILSCTSTCEFTLAACRPANGAGGIVGGGGIGGNFGAGGYPPPGTGGYVTGTGGYVFGSGGIQEGTGGYLGSGGASTCDRELNWLIDCSSDLDCGGCLSCVQVCSACTPNCADPCQSDLDCTGKYIGTLATPYCFLLDATYGGRCSSSP
jgi:hypothetical protein